MTIGYSTDKATVDARLGNTVIALRNTLDDVRRIQAWLAATPDATLLAAPYGYTQAEVNTMKSAFTDLLKLANIANGTVVQATTYDFQNTFAGKLTGLS